MPLMHALCTLTLTVILRVRGLEMLVLVQVRGAVSFFFRCTEGSGQAGRNIHELDILVILQQVMWTLMADGRVVNVAIGNVDIVRQ